MLNNMLNLIWKCQGKHAFSWWKLSRSFSFLLIWSEKCLNCGITWENTFPPPTTAVKIPFSLKWYGTFFGDRLVGTAVKIFCLSQAISGDPPLGWQQWYRLITSHTLCSGWVGLLEMKSCTLWLAVSPCTQTFPVPSRKCPKLRKQGSY